MKNYEVLYDSHAKADMSDEAVGHGEYDLFGRIELDPPAIAGLRPGHTLVDFGCGDGWHAVGTQGGGTHIGIGSLGTLLLRTRFESPTGDSRDACERNQYS